MDVSPEYVKMCKKAEEIQKDHKWESGDVPYRAMAYYGCFCPARCPFSEKGLTWLPRQDQLQEMVQTNKSLIEFWQMQRGFCLFCHTENWLEIY